MVRYWEVQRTWDTIKASRVQVWVTQTSQTDSCRLHGLCISECIHIFSMFSDGIHSSNTLQWICRNDLRPVPRKRSPPIALRVFGALKSKASSVASHLAEHCLGSGITGRWLWEPRRSQHHHFKSHGWKHVWDFALSFWVVPQFETHPYIRLYVEWIAVLGCVFFTHTFWRHGILTHTLTEWSMICCDRLFPSWRSVTHWSQRVVGRGQKWAGTNLWFTLKAAGLVLTPTQPFWKKHHSSQEHWRRVQAPGHCPSRLYNLSQRLSKVACQRGGHWITVPNWSNRWVFLAGGDFGASIFENQIQNDIFYMIFWVYLG